MREEGSFELRSSQSMAGVLMFRAGRLVGARSGRASSWAATPTSTTP